MCRNNGHIETISGTETQTLQISDHCYSMEVKHGQYEQNYSLQNDIRMKNSRLYQIGSQKK